MKNLPSLTNEWLKYSELNIIQKINVKGNTRAYMNRMAGCDNDAIYIAKVNIPTFQYDSPFYFSGANPMY